MSEPLAVPVEILVAIRHAHPKRFSLVEPLSLSLWPWEDPLLHAMVLMSALAWDRWLGEPPIRLHPVVWMGLQLGGCGNFRNLPLAPGLAHGMLPLASAGWPGRHFCQQSAVLAFGY